MDKPKQGKGFREFRGEIMNFKVDYDNKVKKRYKCQDCRSDIIRGK